MYVRTVLKLHTYICQCTSLTHLNVHNNVHFILGYEILYVRKSHVLEIENLFTSHQIFKIKMTLTFKF